MSIKVGDEITSRRNGGAFIVWYINQNGSYYCCLLDGVGEKAVRRPEHGKDYAEAVTCNIWGYDAVKVSDAAN